jgi:hypothetical protein
MLRILFPSRSSASMLGAPNGSVSGPPEIPVSAALAICASPWWRRHQAPFRETNFSLPRFVSLSSFGCVASADSIAGLLAFIPKLFKCDSNSKTRISAVWRNDLTDDSPQ